MKTKPSNWIAGLLLLLLATGAAVLIAGCVTPPSSAGAGGAATAENAKGGAQLWSENCARCHNSRSPSIFSDAQWDVAMHHMRVRANLTATEYRKVLEFMKSAN